MLALVFPGRARAEPPLTHNWNQWDEPGHDGIAASMQLLGLGATFAPTNGRDVVTLHGSFERLVLDRLGIFGRAGLSVYAGSPHVVLVPMLGGANLHVVPKNPLDPYVGAGGGLTWISPGGARPMFATTLEAHAGVDFFYWGIFCLQGEGGWELKMYASPDGTANLGTPFGRLTAGIYF